MADKVVTMFGKNEERFDLLYKDNGDGTYSIAAHALNQGSTPVSVLLPASELHIGAVSGLGDSVHTEFTRPADTTPYAVNDVVGPAVTGLLNLGNLGRVSGSSLYIVKARLMTDQSGNTAAYRLHIYQNNTPTPIADNSQFALLWANRAIRVGFIDFDAMTTEGTGSDSAMSLNKDIRLHIKCASSARNLYGVLVTKTIFTPASGQSFFLDLNVEQD